VEDQQDGEDQRRAQQDDPAPCQAYLYVLSSLLCFPGGASLEIRVSC
jgi:hypothetical protein